MNDLKILNIYERIFLRKAKFMYKISKSITPSYINAMFTFRPINETLLSLRSVNTSNFHTPRPQKEIFKQSLIYSGPVIWNGIAILRACGPRACGLRACGPQIASNTLYVKPKICDQCYFSYYPLPLPPTPIKKGKKEQCTIINTMCIVVKNLYALYVQLFEPLNSLYTLAT